MKSPWQITSYWFLMTTSDEEAGLKSTFHLSFFFKTKERQNVKLGSPIKQEDPPNLSILLSGGKETNKDSLSKGD